MAYWVGAEHYIGGTSSDIGRRRVGILGPTGAYAGWREYYNDVFLPIDGFLAAAYPQEEKFHRIWEPFGFHGHPFGKREFFAYQGAERAYATWLTNGAFEYFSKMTALAPKTAVHIGFLQVDTYEVSELAAPEFEGRLNSTLEDLQSSDGTLLMDEVHKELRRYAEAGLNIHWDNSHPRDPESIGALLMRWYAICTGLEVGTEATHESDDSHWSGLPTMAYLGTFRHRHVGSGVAGYPNVTDDASFNALYKRCYIQVYPSDVPGVETVESFYTEAHVDQQQRLCQEVIAEIGDANCVISIDARVLAKAVQMGRTVSDFTGA